jgi:hypothetical protein
MKKCCIIFNALILFILCYQTGYAQSDNCVLGSSTLLTPAAAGAACSPVAGNTSSGFTDSGQGCTNGNEDDDGWYRFVATSTNHTVTVDGASNMDPVLGIYSNCSGTQPTGGGCVDATGTDGIETRALSGLTIGATYYICVHDYAAGGGNFTICITTSAPIITMGNTTSTGCSFTFLDNGGTGNYSNSQNLVHTFCPSSAGQCITAAFTSFDLEDNFDYLSVYDGNSTSAPMIVGSSFSANSPGTISATTINTSGCLTFRFSSDGGSGGAGWSANISCGSCAAPPGTVTVVQQDCIGANTICNNQSVTGTSLGSGQYNDVNIGLGNSGCLNDYATNPNGSAEHQSHWYYFSPSASGTIGMTIAPSSATTDYDWAIWGPYATLPCPPTGAPLRCSAASASGSSGGQTGLGNGAADTEEGSGGNGWVSSISVTAGQKYILFLDNWNATSAPYTLSWQLSGGASLACTTLPIELLSFTGSYKTDYNLIEWITASEKDNDHFTVERSLDAVTWEVLGIIKGAGNSTQTKFYNYQDYTFAGNAINYYRLKQTDTNADFEYSPIISIETSEESKIAVKEVYPNPANETINSELFTPTNGEFLVEILDFTGSVVGKNVLQVKSGKNILTTDMSTLKNGIYLLKITSEKDNFKSVTKVIKN